MRLVNGPTRPDLSPSRATELFRGGGLASSNSGFIMGTMARDGACAAAIRLTGSSILLPLEASLAETRGKPVKTPGCDYQLKGSRTSCLRLWSPSPPSKRRGQCTFADRTFRIRSDFDCRCPQRCALPLCCCGVVRVHARARRVLPVRLTHCAEEARRNHAPTWTICATLTDAVPAPGRTLSGVSEPARRRHHGRHSAADELHVA